MNLYDQLLRLQVIEDAYIEWKSYRKQLTHYITENTQSKENIAILGAGRCNDIDLKSLVTHFKEVILLDKDEEGMKEGICNQGLIKAGNLKIKKVDFLGITDDDYRRFANKLIEAVRQEGKMISCKKLTGIALKELALIEDKIERNFIYFEEGQYENIALVGIYSQLFSMLEWIWSIILQTIEKNEEKVRTQIIALNQKYIKRFNDEVLKAGQEMIIVGYEKGRIGRVGSIQGAVQAIEDLAKREKEGEVSIVDELEIIWPFNTKQGIKYQMVIQSIKKQ